MLASGLHRDPLRPEFDLVGEQHHVCLLGFAGGAQSVGFCPMRVAEDHRRFQSPGSDVCLYTTR